MSASFTERLFSSDDETPYELLQRRKTLDVMLRVILVAGFSLFLVNIYLGAWNIAIALLIMSVLCLPALRLNSQGRYLLFMTDDVPYEEALSIHLLDAGWRRTRSGKRAPASNSLSSFALSFEIGLATTLYIDFTKADQGSVRIPSPRRGRRSRWTTVRS